MIKDVKEVEANLAVGVESVVEGWRKNKRRREEVKDEGEGEMERDVKHGGERRRKEKQEETWRIREESTRRRSGEWKRKEKGEGGALRRKIYLPKFWNMKKCEKETK